MRTHVALLFSVVAWGGLAGCGPSLAPLEAWSMTIKRVSECSVVGAGAPQCTAEDDLAARTTRGRWLFEHGAEASFSVTLETGATFAGIYFPDDGQTLAEDTPPCFGQGGLCYFARDRSSLADGDADCRSGSEHVVVARLTEEDGERKLLAVVSERVQELEQPEGECQIVSLTETVDSGEGVFETELSRARAEAADSGEGAE